MPEAIGPEEVRRVAEAALDVEGADGVEVLFLHEWSGLTRFANSVIHQSTWRDDTGLRIRVVRGNRIGVAATNELSPEGARRAAASAVEMAEVSSPDPAFPGFAPPAEIPPQPPGAFDRETADATPEARADAVAALVGQIGAGFRGAGAFETAAAEVAVANTEGQFCYAPSTQATLTTVVSGGEGGAGAAEVTATAARDIDPETLGRTAYAKARDSQSPRELPPGEYEVVLEPLAVSTLVSFLGYIALGGRAIEEGRSPLAGRTGDRVCAEAVTIADDAFAARAPGLPFDFEGTPRSRVVAIERGVFRSGVYDRRSAGLAGRTSTGHALPAPNPEGPIPLNLSLEPGEASLEEMIASTERGLLVTRFHYTNVVNPIETTLTGMTRDGTWLIENGRIAHPVRNLRFTQSILGALSNVEMVGREAAAASEFLFGTSLTPALKISRFVFSGASDH